MITTLSQAPDAVFLEPGDTFRTALDAGTRLQVAQGRVRLTSPPRWLGDAVWTAQSVLHEGELHGLAHGGWIEVTALAPVQLRIHAPAAAAARPGRATQEDAASVRTATRRPVMRLVQLLTGW